MSASRAAHRFQPLRSAVFDLFTAGDPGAALPVALEAEARFPAKGEVPFWLACIQCRLGDPDAALAALTAGLARGHYWPQEWLLEDDDLETLRARPELDPILRASARARIAASRAVDLDPVRLAAPEVGDDVAPVARVLALHGWGQDADEFALHWQAAAAHGFAIVVPRSSQQLSPGFFVWDDREIARADVTAQFCRAHALLPDLTEAAAPPPLLVAGFSQGGGLAVDLAVDAEPAPSVGFLAIAVGVEDLAPPPPNPDRLASGAARGLRGRLLVGDEDEALAGAHALAEVADACGLKCALTVRPRAGHEMPEPPGRLLVGELTELLGPA
jgi:predicted esterase